MAGTIAVLLAGDSYQVAESYAKIKAQFLGPCGEEIFTSSTDEARRLMSCEPFEGNRIVLMNAEDFDEPFRDRLMSPAGFPSSCMLVVRGKPQPLIWKPLEKIGPPAFRKLYFEEPRVGEDLTPVIRRRAEALGVAFAAGAAETLAAMIGPDVAGIDSELRKLFILADVITVDLVTRHCVPAESGEFFRLYSYLAGGDTKAAVKEAEKLSVGMGTDPIMQALFKLVVIAARTAIDGPSAIVIPETAGRFNSKWWPDGFKQTDPKPSYFMGTMGKKLANRHGPEGLRKLLCMLSSRKSGVREEPAAIIRTGVLHSAVLALCGGKA